jgi:hypothetical protein
MRRFAVLVLLLVGTAFGTAFGQNHLSVNPEYDGTTAVTWTVGLPSATTGTYRGGSSGEGEGAWEPFITLIEDLQPGTYTWTGVDFYAGFANADNVSDLRVVILEAAAGAIPSTGTFTPVVGTEVSITASQPGGTSSTRVNVTFTTAVSFTAATGKQYAWAILARKVTADAGRPGVDTQNDAQGPALTYYAPSGYTASTATEPPTSYTGLAVYRHIQGNIDLTTTNRKLVNKTLTYSTGTAYVALPVAASTNYIIALRDCSAAVADGALTVALCTDSAGDVSVLNSVVLDFAAANQVTFNATSVALNASESADDFDIYLNVQSSGKIGCLFCNVTDGQYAGAGETDRILVHHASAAAAARATANPTIAAPTYLKITSAGTVTLDSVEVLYEPIVILGDSQAIDNAARLGGTLPTAFTHERGTIFSTVSGSRLTATVAGTHTAGYLRYKHGTAGSGDLCELRGVLYVLAGMGLNDVSAYVGTTAQDQVVAEMLARTAEIVDDAKTNGNSVLLIGLPPYSVPGLASSYEAAAIRQFNAGLVGLGIATRTACYDPWFAMTNKSTFNDDVPTFAAAYCAAADDPHYNAAGAALVAAAAAAQYEANRATSGRPWLVTRMRPAQGVGSFGLHGGR